ncbi:relaxin-3b [Aplochiton taeniatus]
MWKAGVLSVVLLVALVGRAQSTEGYPSIYGVKLCGREFIRAVIFTCGGSRWRRSAGDSDVVGGAFDPWRLNSVLKVSDQQIPTGPEPKAWPAQDTGSSEAVFSRLAHSPLSEEVLEALRGDRRGRDVVVGLSNACCKWGCSKSEISSLC